jgi:hypothetical protein
LTELNGAQGKKDWSGHWYLSLMTTPIFLENWRFDVLIAKFEPLLGPNLMAPRRSLVIKIPHIVCCINSLRAKCYVTL